MVRAATRRSSALRLASLALLGGLLAACEQGSVSPLELGAPLADACVGAEPPESAWSAEPSGTGSPASEGPPIGEPPPRFALVDFQPQSCGFGGVYGLEPFRGEVTLLVAVESS
jgi:hypothetical protein